MSVEEGFIFGSLEAGERVLGEMLNILDKSNFVTVGDLRDLVGIPATYRDFNVGWSALWGSEVRPVPNGFLLDLPEPKKLVV